MASARTTIRFPPLAAAIQLQDAPLEVLRLLERRWMAELGAGESAFSLRWRLDSSRRRVPTAMRASMVRRCGTEADLVLANRGGSVRWRRGQRRATVTLRRGCLGQGLLLEPLVEAALGLALAAAGVCFVHAAAVALADRRLLVLGPSGSGKSTLTAAALVAGGWAVSDDSLLLAARGGRRLARAARRDLWLRPGDNPLTRALRRHGLTAAPDGRQRLPRRRLENRLRLHFEPDGILLLRRDRRLRDFRLRPVPQAEALAALLRGTSALPLTESCLTESHPTGSPPSLLALLSGFAEALPATELRAGRQLIREPAECLEAIRAALPPSGEAGARRSRSGPE